MSDRVLTVWTIFRSPRDYPDKYVVRGFDVVRGVLLPVPHEKPLVVCESLEGARRHIPPASNACLPRSPNDEPHIVESWI